ncbi:hypothetical protein BDR07DRAFT_1484289 [Suillus spraguei]|nr:hypothetical protein BDR07DRAFT_1488571 [Suillus spraguei]KAG2362823.1 hypothetical protein BDR07DRAFT_1484289 [Suillus spraguei]
MLIHSANQDIPRCHSHKKSILIQLPHMSHLTINTLSLLASHSSSPTSYTYPIKEMTLCSFQSGRLEALGDLVRYHIAVGAMVTMQTFFLILVLLPQLLSIIIIIFLLLLPP